MVVVAEYFQVQVVPVLKVDKVVLMEEVVMVVLPMQLVLLVEQALVAVAAAGVLQVAVLEVTAAQQLRQPKLTH